jgi:hypothetical protein
MLVHVLVGFLGRLLRLLERRALGFGELDLGARERGLDALACGDGLLAYLRGGGAQQFLGVGDDDFSGLRQACLCWHLWTWILRSWARRKVGGEREREAIVFCRRWQWQTRV